MKILLTGGNGYIAKQLRESFSSEHDVVSVSRDNFDLSDSALVSEWFKGKKFDVVIHTAAVGGSRLSPDGQDVIQQNLMMYYNLLMNKNHFDKLISFGSGAEIFSPYTPYGWSKKVIADSIAQTENFYNIRIFGVFDENELPTRFIKSNLVKILNNVGRAKSFCEAMVVHDNKIMDFFYMQDLVTLVRYYIENSNPEKEINCSYVEKYTLYSIAEIINKITKSNTPIEISDKNISSEIYCGFSKLPFTPVGLLSGIEDTYNQLKLKKGSR